jgi:hypothetical protein
VGGCGLASLLLPGPRLAVLTSRAMGRGGGVRTPPPRPAGAPPWPLP